MASNFKEWYLQLYDRRRDRPIDDDSGSFQVYTAGTPSRVSIQNAAGTTLTQEVVATASTTFLSRTMTDGVMRFYTADTVSSVDVSVLTAGGRAYFLKALIPSNHRIDVDVEKQEYTLVAAFNEKGSSTTVRSLGFRLRKGMALKDVYVNVVAVFDGSAATASHQDFGRSGDADGFIDGLVASTVGFKQAAAISSTGTIVFPQIIGADMRAMKTGNATNFGWLVRKSYLVQTGVASNNLVFKRATALTASVTAQSGTGYVYYVYSLLPTASANP